jgi:hypothetical protein
VDQEAPLTVEKVDSLDSGLFFYSPSLEMGSFFTFVDLLSVELGGMQFRCWWALLGLTCRIGKFRSCVFKLEMESIHTLLSAFTREYRIRVALSIIRLSMTPYPCLKIARISLPPALPMEGDKSQKSNVTLLSQLPGRNQGSSVSDSGLVVGERRVST